MKNFLISTLILSATVFLYSTNTRASNNDALEIFIQLGSEKLVIKNPDRFIETSQNSKEIWDLANEFVTEDSIILSHYITKKDFNKYKAGESPELKEYFYIKTPKILMGSISTQEQFDTLRKSVYSLNKDNLLNIEAYLNQFTENYSAEESIKNGSQVKLKVGQVVPVSVNESINNFMSFTMLSQIEIANKSKLESTTVVITRGSCFIKGKLIFIDYFRVLSSPDDLRKSREIVETFSKALIKDNL
jgi:hypothetical protein